MICFYPKYSNQLLQYQNISLPHIANFENIFDWQIENMLTIFVFFYWDFFRFEQLTRKYDVKFFTGF